MADIQTNASATDAQVRNLASDAERLNGLAFMNDLRNIDTNEWADALNRMLTLTRSDYGNNNGLPYIAIEDHLDPATSRDRLVITGSFGDLNHSSPLQTIAELTLPAKSPNKPNGDR